MYSNSFRCFSVLCPLQNLFCLFSDADLPEGATIASMAISIEHFESKGFADKKLQWKIGTGWPDNPEEWFSIDAPIHEGQDEESADLWEITSWPSELAPWIVAKRPVKRLLLLVLVRQD